MINAIVALAAIGGVLGLLLGIADKYLKVEVTHVLMLLQECLPVLTVVVAVFPAVPDLQLHLLKVKLIRYPNVLLQMLKRKQQLLNI